MASRVASQITLWYVNGCLKFSLYIMAWDRSRGRSIIGHVSKSPSESEVAEIGTMAVEVFKTGILKPAPSGDSPPPAAASPNDMIPLTIFDRAAFDLHVAVLYAFQAPMPSNEVMKDGLAKALAHFPHLAGRLVADDHNRPCIHLNGAGVRVIETYVVGATLSERLPLDPSEELRQLRPPIEGVEEVMQIQLNRFACGGLVIGQTAHHRVADGQSMSAFFVAWARLVRGEPLHRVLDPAPFHDRAGIAIPRDPPRCEYNHRDIEFRSGESATVTQLVSVSSIDNMVVRFSADFVARLKRAVGGAAGGHRYSTFECLLAHLWKKVTLARGLRENETTRVRVAVNGRARMKPAVPMEYFGNLVLWAYPKLAVKDLLNESYGFVAKTIHDAVAKIDERYFQSFVDFGELLKLEDDGEGDGSVVEELEGTAPEIGNSLSPNLEVDSWLRFRFHDLDFGGGAPCTFLPPNLPVEGLLIMVPSCKETGAVDVYMSLSPESGALFRQISYSLD